MNEDQVNSVEWTLEISSFLPLFIFFFGLVCSHNSGRLVQPEKIVANVEILEKPFENDG